MKHAEHTRRELLFLISFLLLFGIIFLVSLLNLRRHIPTLGIGLSYVTENWIIMILSILAIVKVFGMILRSD